MPPSHKSSEVSGIAVDRSRRRIITAYLKEDFDGVRFERTAALDVVSVMHQGAYEEMGSAFAYAVEWIERNGYEIAGEPRSSYIDGIWNKDDVAEWLTEVQIPIKRMRSLE